MKPWRSRTTFERILLLGSPSAVVKRLKSKTGRSWPCCWPGAEQYSRHTRRRTRHLRALLPLLEFRELTVVKFLVCRITVGMSPLKESSRRHGGQNNKPLSSTRLAGRQERFQGTDWNITKSETTRKATTTVLQDAAWSAGSESKLLPYLLIAIILCIGSSALAIMSAGSVISGDRFFMQR